MDIVYAATMICLAQEQGPATGNALSALSYDQTSKPIGYNGNALSFDAEDRLTEIAGVLTAGYRGDGLRAWKQNSGGTTYFLYSGTLLVCEMSASGAATAVNTFGAAGLLSRHTSSGSAFYTFDAHGSVCQRVSGGGAVLSTQAFDAYGLRQSTDSNSDPYAGFGGQSGYYTDWEAGTAASALEMLGLRYYDPSAGRFLTRDPASYGGGANLYEYCNNQPLGGGDPGGTGEGFPWGSPAGGCLASIVVNGIAGLLNPSTNYDVCLMKEDCLAEMGAAGIAWGIISGIGTAIAASFIEAEPWFLANAKWMEGCLEGFLSGLGHIAAEKDCQQKYCQPDALLDSFCDVIGVVIDTLLGCIDGLIGGELPKQAEEWLNQRAEAAAESIIAGIAQGEEQACANPI